MAAISQLSTEFLSNSKLYSPLIQSKPSNPNQFLAKPVSFRAYPTLRCHNRNKNLFSTISKVRKAYLIAPVLNKWIKRGREIRSIDLQRLIRNLRSLKRFSNALQVSEWMIGQRHCPFSSSDCAVHLDLLGAVHGSKVAEDFFTNLSDNDKDEKTYGAIFNCYVREGLFLKSLTLFKKMKEMGYGSSPLLYSNLMCLYKNANKLEKIPEVLSEMKENNIRINNFSYNICITAYGELSDLNSMEKLLEEMESQPHISMTWNTYSVVANFFIKSNDKEKAVFYLKKLEEIVGKDSLGYNHLISHYASLGNADEVWRLWGDQKTVCKKHINGDYITMLSCLVKLGEFDRAETLLLKGWDIYCRTYDFRVPNTLLIGFCQKGLVERAEQVLQVMVEKGERPTPNSWAIISAGYSGRGEMDKAFECMKRALLVRENNKKWMPKQELVSSLINWLRDQNMLEELDDFMWSLHEVIESRNISTKEKGKEMLMS